MEGSGWSTTREPEERRTASRTEAARSLTIVRPYMCYCGRGYVAERGKDAGNCRRRHLRALAPVKRKSNERKVEECFFYIFKDLCVIGSVQYFCINKCIIKYNVCLYVEIWKWARVFRTSRKKGYFYLIIKKLF